MELICGILFFIIGCLMLTKPKTIWKIAESWKLKTYAKPTELYLILIRTAGGILVIGGILTFFLK